MLRISKIVDYGILVLTHMGSDSSAVYSANELATSLSLGQPIVSKVLKLLAQHELVSSIRGARGGYKLARDASAINIAQVIDALEDQPFGLTECTALPGVCSVEDLCHIRPYWQRINLIVRSTLEAVSVADMISGDASIPIDLTKTQSKTTANIPNWSIAK